MHLLLISLLLIFLPSIKSLTPSPLTNPELQRYARHLVLPSFTILNQSILKSSSVLVIGAGGLGSPALLYLSSMGVGTIGIVDGDTVDISNLQRQVIHSESDVGALKCKSAASA